MGAKSGSDAPGEEDAGAGRSDARLSAMHGAWRSATGVATKVLGAFALVAACAVTVRSVPALRTSRQVALAAAPIATEKQTPGDVTSTQVRADRPIVARMKVRDLEEKVTPKTFGQKALAFARRVAPGLLAMFVLSQILRVAFERFKRQQMEKIKQQLGAMGGFNLEEMAKMLEDAGGMGNPSGKAGAPSARDTATLARQLLGQIDSKAAAGPGSREDLASKMRVTFGGDVDEDVFQGVREAAESKLASMLEPAANAYEQALVDVIEQNLTPAKTRELLHSAAVTMGWGADADGGEASAKQAFGLFGSKQFSKFIDRAASNIQSDDRTALINLNALALAVKRVNSAALAVFPAPQASTAEPITAEQAASAAAEALSPDSVQIGVDGGAAVSASQDSASSTAAAAANAVDAEAIDAIDLGIEFRYLGSVVSGVDQTAELYKRYAVYCLSSDERVAEDLNSMLTVQKILSISDEDAQKINTDIARGMFQVAASAAVADGSIDDKTREQLNALQDSLGSMLDSETAEGITDETSLMRVLYGLKSMLKDQEITAEDVKELRKMTKSFGIDLDDMLKNADELGAQLGPDGKEFLETMKKLLSEAETKGSATMS